MEGTTLGKYRVGRRLGAGGMGVVYVGEHELLGNQVAVKVINPELARSEGSVTRFLNEAVSAARIKHAGIVQIFDYGADATSGSAYFVMELLDGESLAERLARVGWLDTAHALRLVAQIADTLRAAHAAGIIHRDLKPDNVFLVPDPLVPGGERIKLLDFGIAKLFGDGLGGGASATRTGDVLGTPYYMSPEQCRGAGLVDHRADIYSLGCVLFRLVCGRVPFPGEGVGEILAAHIHVAPPAPRSLRPDIPEALEQLILQMLAKSPDERLQSMTAVLGAVAAVAEVCGIDGATPSGQVWVADARSSELAQTAVGAAASVGELAYAATARVAGGPVSEEAAATLAGPSEAAATMAASGGAASAEDMSQEASSSASPRRSLARGLALGLSAALVGGLGAGVYYFAGASGMQPGDVSSGPAPRDVDDEALARVDLPPVEPLEPVAPALEIPVASVDELPRLDDVPPLALKPVDDKRAKRARKRFDEGGELLAAGELEAAINTYVAGLKEDPGNVDMRYNLACAYVLSGAPVRGLALLREFKEVGCAFCVGRLIRAREDNDWRAIWGHPVFEALTADAAVEVTEFTESAQALVAALVETGDPSSVERLFHPRRAATVSIEHDGCTPDSGHRCVERERLGGTSAIAAWLVARHEAHRDGSAPLSVGRLLACDEEHCCEFDGPTIERPGTLYLDELCFEVDSGSVPYLERVALHDLEA